MVREREFYDACRADNLLRAREILSDDVNIDWVNDLDEHRTAIHAALQGKFPPLFFNKNFINRILCNFTKIFQKKISKNPYKKLALGRA
jgi:hypothetical protein